MTAVDVTKNINFAWNTIYAAAQGFRGAGGRASGAVNGNNPYRHNDGPGISPAGKAAGTAGTPPWLFADVTPFDRTDVAGTVAVNTGSIYGYAGGKGTATNFNYAKGAPGNAGGGSVVLISPNWACTGVTVNASGLTPATTLTASSIAGATFTSTVTVPVIQTITIFA